MANEKYWFRFSGDASKCEIWTDLGGHPVSTNLFYVSPWVETKLATRTEGTSALDRVRKAYTYWRSVGWNWEPVTLPNTNPFYYGLDANKFGAFLSGSRITTGSQIWKITNATYDMNYQYKGRRPPKITPTRLNDFGQSKWQY